MLLSTSEEIISRFVGLALTPLVDQWRDIEYDGTSTPFPRLQLEPLDTLGDVRVDGFLQARLMPHRIEMENDIFVLRDAFTLPVPGPGPIVLTIPELDLPGLPDPGFDFPANGLGRTLSFEWGYEITYQPGWMGSILSTYHQLHILDDRDSLTMGEGPAAEFIETIAQTFRDMVALTPSLAPAPELPDTMEEMQALLTVSPEGAGHDPLLAEHAGTYVDGQAIADGEAAPDIFALLESLQDRPEPEEGSATLATGGNTVVNETSLVSLNALAPVSIVMGDWHETNSISQVILRTGDASGTTGLSSSPDSAYNAASFERIDPYPGPAPLPSAFPFAVNYTVDVIHAEIRIVNYLAQMQVVLDGDSVVLTAVHHEATFDTGDNLALNSFDITALFGQYDLVIIGGSVFEGNFLRQIAVLGDDDALGGQAGVSGAAGGNLVANYGSIVNYGTTDFSQMDAELRDLVSRMSTGQPAGDDAGAYLGFLGHSNISVLYLDGGIYEMNVVDQVAVLDDSDTIQVMEEISDALAARTGHALQWQISTGENAVVNAATILDVDDASVVRYLDGDYYSQSMLVQADIVADGPEDIQTFDTDTLVPEVIAFTTFDPQEDEAATSSGYVPGADFASGHHDGLGGMAA